MTEELISIVMPAYNAGAFIGDAVRSVIGQEHQEWELIIINDGSTDDTAGVLAGFDDPRISVLHQENQGVCAARNRGLEHVTGRFLATLDADDVLPPRSLSSRLEVFRRNPAVSFVDGVVTVMDRDLRNIIRVHRPSFRGEPLPELVRLTGSCFFGPTWLIRLEPGMTLEFDEHITHAEDLLFYISIARSRLYDHTDENVLIYRRTGGSAMSDLEGLHRGYQYVYEWLKQHPEEHPPGETEAFRRRIRSISMRSFMKAGQWSKGLRLLLGLGAR